MSHHTTGRGRTGGNIDRIVGRMTRINFGLRTILKGSAKRKYFQLKMMVFDFIKNNFVMALPLSESLACILVTNRDSLPRDVAALVALIDEFSDPLRFDITEFRLFIRGQKDFPFLEHIIEHFCS